MSANKSESASNRESNQPAPASEPAVEEGGADYKPSTDAGASVVEDDSASAPGEGSKIGERELNSLDQNAILDDTSSGAGVQTRGVDSHPMAADDKIDEQVADLE